MDLYRTVDQLGASSWSGPAWRHTSPGRDPLSGIGARLNGGRWNPPGVSTIYLADRRPVAVSEFVRMSEGQARGVESFLPRWVHELAIQDLPVLDLRTDEALEVVGLDRPTLSDDDWGPCQAVGQAADYLGFAGLVAPSATGHGVVLAVYERHAHHGELTAVDHIVLAATEDVTAALS